MGCRRWWRRSGANCAKVLVMRPNADADASARTDAPIGRTSRSLPAQLADHLLDAILTGRLAAGVRLKELSLAQEHAVSRATVREALILLEKSRFVERVPRFGARVATPITQDVLQLFEVRGALLGVAAAHCAGSEGDGVIPELRRIVNEMRRHTHADADPFQFAELSIAAQHLLLRASGNRYLIELYEQLANLGSWHVVRSRALSFVEKGRRAESLGDWESVLQAIELGQVDAAERAVRTVLAHSAIGVSSQLALAPDGDAGSS